MRRALDWLTVALDVTVAAYMMSCAAGARSTQGLIGYAVGTAGWAIITMLDVRRLTCASCAKTAR